MHLYGKKTAVYILRMVVKVPLCHVSLCLPFRLAGPEPHPDLPDLNFDSGAIKLNYWSTIRQAYTYEDRVQAAGRIAALVHPYSILLLDDLQGNPYSKAPMDNPVWCTYGHGARPVFVIGKNGTVLYSRPWFHAEELEQSLQVALAKEVLL